MDLPFDIDRSYGGVVGIIWKPEASNWGGTNYDFVDRLAKDPRFGPEAIDDLPFLLVGSGAERLSHWLIVALASRFAVIAMDVGVSSTAQSRVVYSAEPWINREGSILPIGLAVAWKGCEPQQVAEVLNQARKYWNSVPERASM